MQSKLDDVSMVKDNVKQMKGELTHMSREYERKIREVELSENALKQLLTDHEMAKQKVIQVTSSLQDCSGSRKVIMNKLKNTNEQLRNVRRVEKSLANELESTSNQYRQSMLNRDADISREKIRMRSKENILKQRVDIAKSANDQLEHQISRLNKQNSMTENTLIDTVVNNAEQVQGIVNAKLASIPSTHIKQGSKDYNPYRDLLRK